MGLVVVFFSGLIMPKSNHHCQHNDMFPSQIAVTVVKAGATETLIVRINAIICRLIKRKALASPRAVYGLFTQYELDVICIVYLCDCRLCGWAYIMMLRVKGQHGDVDYWLRSYHACLQFWLMFSHKLTFKRVFCIDLNVRQFDKTLNATGSSDSHSASITIGDFNA
jgi:hypothetical protein